MTMKMYSVRDLATNQFNQPFCELADDSAIRGFSYQINNNGIMGFKPCDFHLSQDRTLQSGKAENRRA